MSLDDRLEKNAEIELDQLRELDGVDVLSHSRQMDSLKATVDVPRFSDRNKMANNGWTLKQERDNVYLAEKTLTIHPDFDGTHPGP